MDGRLFRDNVGIPVPVPQIPGIWTGTQSHETVGNGTKICGTIPLRKSHGTTNPDISGQESRSVPGRFRCPGIPWDAYVSRLKACAIERTIGTGLKKHQTVLSRPLPIPVLEYRKFRSENLPGCRK